MKKLSGIIGLAFAFTGAAHAATESATVYYWTDANGVMHFSDTPVAGKTMQTKQIDIANPPAINPNPVPQASDTNTQANQQASDTNTQANQQAVIAYSLSITSPLAEETIRSNEGKIRVQSQLSPALPDNEPVNLFLNIDSTRYPCNTAALSCQADNIVRGAHQLKTELVDQSGKILASSESITIYLHQTIVAK